jgi:hypothetical protein
MPSVCITQTRHFTVPLIAMNLLVMPGQDCTA